MKSFYVTLALCFVCSISASTQGSLGEGAAVSAQSGEGGEDYSEYLEACKKSGTTSHQLLRFNAPFEMVRECAKTAVDSGNDDLVVQLMRFGVKGGGYIPDVFNYAAQKDKRELLKKMCAVKKSQKGDCTKLAKGALEVYTGKNEQVRKYLQRKAEGKKATWGDLWSRT